MKHVTYILLGMASFIAIVLAASMGIGIFFGCIWLLLIGIPHAWTWFSQTSCFVYCLCLGILVLCWFAGRDLYPKLFGGKK